MQEPGLRLSSTLGDLSERNRSQVPTKRIACSLLWAWRYLEGVFAVFWLKGLCGLHSISQRTDQIAWKQNFQHALTKSNSEYLRAPI